MPWTGLILQGKTHCRATTTTSFAGLVLFTTQLSGQFFSEEWVHAAIDCMNILFCFYFRVNIVKLWRGAHMDQACVLWPTNRL